MDFKWVLALIDRLGFRTSGVICIVVGIVWILPFFGVQAYIAQGFGWLAVGIGMLAFGKKAKDDAVSEAEKRIANPNLPPSSSVPAIQAEIVKLTK